ncbi:MAG: VacJ family lipoprotein [Rhodocyclales bacterium]|nr:VacJ family lipoprotein [Rhodocyclales bacterium]
MKSEMSGARVGVFALACVMLIASGCASRPANPDDPLESYNRAVFSFNEGADRAVIRPMARVYDAVTPKPVQTGVGNFFSNLGDIWIGLNNVLQGKVADGLSDWMRFAVNTTLGVAGLLDVASEMKLPKHDEDLGQTLGTWGFGEGAYFVVPLMGPRTVRDTLALPLDLKGDNVWTIDHVSTRNVLTGVRFVHQRARLLSVERTLDEGALDKYAFTRDFYLQQRRYKVHDGNVPVEYEDYDALPENGSTKDGEAVPQ